MLNPKRAIEIILASGTILATSVAVQAATIRVTVESLTPDGGTFLTPVWTGFHDGSFDIYDRGEAASAGLESIAEDGDFSTLSAEFLASGAGTVDGAAILFG